MNTHTYHGNVGDKIRFTHTGDGTAVLNFSVAINSRFFDRRSGQWKDRPTVWRDVVAFGRLAENAYDSITKGTTVTVIGEERDDSYTKEFDEPGYDDQIIRRVKVVAEDIAVSLRFARAKVTRVARERGEAPAERGEATAPQAVAGRV